MEDLKSKSDIELVVFRASLWTSGQCLSMGASVDHVSTAPSCRTWEGQFWWSEDIVKANYYGNPEAIMVKDSLPVLGGLMA